MSEPTPNPVPPSEAVVPPPVSAEPAPPPPAPPVPPPPVPVAVAIPVATPALEPPPAPVISTPESRKKRLQQRDDEDPPQARSMRYILFVILGLGLLVSLPFVAAMIFFLVVCG
jgi:hypothetical protein